MEFPRRRGGSKKGSHAIRLTRTHIILLWALNTACEEHGFAHDDYSVDAAHSVNLGTLPERALRLSKHLDIGREEGESPSVFGFVSDASFASDGNIVVADAVDPRIVVFDRRGNFLHVIGRVGSGPGEYLHPAKLSISGDTVAVLDPRQARVLFYEMTGRFLRSFPLQQAVPEDIAFNGFTVYVTSGIGEYRLMAYDAVRGTSRGLIRGAPADTPQSGQYPPGGRVCALNDQVRYQNPWIPEIVALTSGLMKRSLVRWDQPRYAPAHTVDRGYFPRVLLVGMACERSYTIANYFDRTTNLLYYDLLSSPVRDISRLVVDREDPTLPGIVADVLGRSLLTYRTRPFSQVSVYEILEAER